MQGSGDYTVEYKFTADVSGLEKGVEEANESIESTKETVLKFAVVASAAIGAFSASSLKSFRDYESTMYGMAAAVDSVGGTIEQAMDGIKQATQSGLLSEQDAAIAIRNLTLYGYSVQEAANMVQAFTNVSIENLKAGENVNEKVIRMTEAVKSESTTILHRNGIIEAGSQANEKYAASIGKSANELDREEKMQALYNATITAGVASADMAAKYHETYSAAVQRLDANMENLRNTFGQILAPAATWLANAASWIVANKELVAGVLRFTSTLIGGGGMILGLLKVVQAVKSAVAWFSALSATTKGLVGVLTAAVMVAAVASTVSAINSMNTGLEDITSSSGEAADGIDDLANSLNGGGGGGGAAGAARDFSDELEKLRRQYLDDLKQIEVRHQETIDKLTKQIQDANIDYRRAVEERNAAFEANQAKEEKKHQEKVDDIMQQLAFLQRYNNEYNRQKLVSLQNALERENYLYKQQTEAAKEELEIQNENDRQAYEEKRQQYQQELDAELAFMAKHREDLKQVQNWILEDEIEALNRRFAEQQASYEKQYAAAGSAGAAIGDNFVTELNKKIKAAQTGQFQTDAYNLGYNTSKDVVVGVWDYIKNVGNSDDNFLAKIWKAILGEDTFNNLKYGRVAGNTAGGAKGWATGGYTGQGNPNEIAGFVHKGEYVLPQDMVDQTTGTPKAAGNTYVINVSGVFATSAAERRRVADQIVTAINQNNKSRLEASWQ